MNIQTMISKWYIIVIIVVIITVWVYRKMYKFSDAINLKPVFRLMRPDCKLYCIRTLNVLAFSHTSANKKAISSLRQVASDVQVQ